MEPTLHNGQYLMVNKLVYRFGDPRRGDIVVFHSPQDRSRALIKRVVGLPGEEVSIVAGKLYVNGMVVEEPYVAGQPTSADWGPRRLGLAEYLVLGDNRNNSNDSRSFGPVHESEIIGKAWFSLWPLTYGLRVPHYNTSAIVAQTANP
jgi:signal peptidase I